MKMGSCKEVFIVNCCLHRLLIEGELCRGIAAHFGGRFYCGPGSTTRAAFILCKYLGLSRDKLLLGIFLFTLLLTQALLDAVHHEVHRRHDE